MGARVTKSSAVRFVQDYSQSIIRYYRYHCAHLELDHVETDGQYIWGRSQDTGTWVILAEADEESIFWLDNKNVTVPPFGNLTYS